MYAFHICEVDMYQNPFDSLMFKVKARRSKVNILTCKS